MSRLGRKYRGMVYRFYHNTLQHDSPETVRDLDRRSRLCRHTIDKFFPSRTDELILELGCGYGAMIYYGHICGYYMMWGVDTSKSQVALAKKLGIAGVKHGDAMRELRRCGTSSLGAVVAFDVLEHFGKDEAVALIKEVRRVLKPGGALICHTVNAESPFFGYERYSDMTHEIAYTRRSFNAICKSLGFSRVVCEDDTPPPHGWKSMVRRGIWKAYCKAVNFILASEQGNFEDRVYTRNMIAVAWK